jgi:hypothetical protein
LGWQPFEEQKKSPVGNDPRISKLKKALYHGDKLLKAFEYNNVHTMKNKHDPALLRTSYLSNEIVKRTPKTHETNPLTLFNS